MNVQLLTLFTYIWLGVKNWKTKKINMYCCSALLGRHGDVTSNAALATSGIRRSPSHIAMVSQQVDLV